MENSSTWVDHIPVLWFEPQIQHHKRQLVLFQHPLGGTKETAIPFLRDLAAKGFVALSFDAWQHGERGRESQQEILNRVFSNFRRHMWPILGQTTLDTTRVLDWAVSSLNVEPSVYLAGLSMGGDVAVSAAGIDRRIQRVAAVIATPDWLRPNMEDVFQPGVILPTGKPDRYAQYFYDHLNPLTNLNAYAHAPQIHFICGEKDTHVPPAGAFQFQKTFQKMYPQAANKITVNLISNLKHLDAIDSSLWWPDGLAWLTQEEK